MPRQYMDPVQNIGRHGAPPSPQHTPCMRPIWCDNAGLMMWRPAPLERTTSSVLTTFPIFYAICMRNHRIIIGNRATLVHFCKRVRWPHFLLLCDGFCPRVRWPHHSPSIIRSRWPWLTCPWLPGLGYQALVTRPWLPGLGYQALVTRPWLPGGSRSV